jgi:hypothetical protein
MAKGKIHTYYYKQICVKWRILVIIFVQIHQVTLFSFWSGHQLCVHEHC